MSAAKPDRSTQITIRLDPKILEGLRDIASRFGVAPTSIAAMAIGEYVAKNQAVLQNQAVMLEATGKELARVMGGPIAALFESKSAEELVKLFSDDIGSENQVDWTEGHD